MLAAVMFAIRNQLPQSSSAPTPEDIRDSDWQKILPVLAVKPGNRIMADACKILMKALWLGRLTRPDIVKPINDLATKVQNWSRAEDKKLLRLIQYISATGFIQPGQETLEVKREVASEAKRSKTW